MKTKKLLSILFTCLFIIGIAIPMQAQKSKKPNVVIMLADNVGWGDIGCFGGGEVRGMPTPQIDKLASEGMQMTQFFVEPGCTPSRAALLLGRMPIRAGLATIIIGGTPNTLQADEVTLGELFKSVGYNTGIMGKWHVGSEEQSWPTRQGFDEYKVGIIETTDGTLYRKHMERQGMSNEAIEKTVPRIWEGTSDSELKMVREYTVEYRKQVEGDIANASVDYINRMSKEDEPFFLYVGWSHAHYPNYVPEEFEGKASHPYGDAIMELDYRTGQVLDAIEKAGIEDNTIVIWISDNANGNSQTMPQGFIGSNNGPFRGELGDALEGSLRVPGMIKWPGKISAGKNNGMVSIQDFFPTLANIIGAKVPSDRPIDGVDQTNFFMGKQENSNREHLLTFVNNELAGIRWRQYRMYPKPFVATFGNPSMQGAMGNRVEGNELMNIYDIKMDPKEEICITADNAWIYRQYLGIIAEYKKSIEKYPNPAGVSLSKPGF